MNGKLQHVAEAKKTWMQHVGTVTADLKTQPLHGSATVERHCVTDIKFYAFYALYAYDAHNFEKDTLNRYTD